MHTGTTDIRSKCLALLLLLQATPRPRCVCVRALAQPAVRFNIHGRHVEVGACLGPVCIMALNPEPSVLMHMWPCTKCTWPRLQVTEKLERHVKERLNAALRKFQGAQFIEAEGGVKDVDVKLM